MLSKALSHFPQFRFRDGQKRLWNPILKKTFVNLPEERVRLALIDYLILQAKLSQARISFESPVKLTGDKSSSRTDIICYDSEFKPLLLVECKAPDIKLDEKAAIQIARYNQKVEAPYLLVSNGVLDFWFEVDGEEMQYKHEIPDIFQSKVVVERKHEYWKDRAFGGQNLDEEAMKFVTENNSQLFEAPHQPIKYLNFDGFDPKFALGHYYRIFGLEEKIKVGLSLSANAFGDTRLNSILNREGANVAFCSISLQAVIEDESVHGQIHSAKGRSEINLSEFTEFSFKQDISSLVPNIYNLLEDHSQ